MKELAFLRHERRKKLFIIGECRPRVGRGGLQATKALEEKLATVRRQLLPGIERAARFLALLGANLGEAARAALQSFPPTGRKLAEPGHSFQDARSLFGRE